MLITETIQSLSLPYYYRNLELGLENFSNYLHWLTNSEENPYIQSVSDNWDLENLKKFVYDVNESSETLLLGIFASANDLHVGNIKFEGVRNKSTSCVLGILIGNIQYRGKGIAAQVIQDTTNYLKNKFEIEEFKLGVNVEHLQAIRAYNKVGFEISTISSDGSTYYMSLR